MTVTHDPEALKVSLCEALFTLGSADAARAAFADANSALNQVMAAEGYVRDFGHDAAFDLDHNGVVDADLYAYAKDGLTIALTLDNREALRAASMAELKDTDRLDHVMGNIYALYMGAEALMDQASSADAQHAPRRDMIAVTNMLNVMRVQLAAELPDTATGSRHLNDVVLVADELVRYVQSDGSVLEANIWGGRFHAPTRRSHAAGRCADQKTQ